MDREPGGLQSMGSQELDMTEQLNNNNKYRHLLHFTDILFVCFYKLKVCDNFAQASLMASSFRWHLLTSYLCVTFWLILKIFQTFFLLLCLLW